MAVPQYGSAVKYGTTFRNSRRSGVQGVKPNLFNYQSRTTRGANAAVSGRDMVGRRITMGSSGG